MADTFILGAAFATQVMKLRLPNNQCPGQLFDFVMMNYTWTASQQNSQDPFTLNVTDYTNQYVGYFAFNAEMAHIAVSPATQAGTGSNPPLTATATLYNPPSGAAGYKWTITGGGGAIVFPNGEETMSTTTNQVMVEEPNPTGSSVPFALNVDAATTAGMLSYGPATECFCNPFVTLLRTSLTTVQATGTPAGGTFNYTTTPIVGTTNASIAFASGSSASTNPNNTVLSDPANPAPLGSPSPGGLLSITTNYQTSSGTGKNTFQVPTFGLSCYYTAYQGDWGTVPDSCTSLRYNNKTYSGYLVNPDGLTGTYCASFIEEASEIQGSAVLNTGEMIQYNPKTNLFGAVSKIVGSDGSAVVAGKTLARDKGVILGKGVLVDLDNVGTGILANDSGGSPIKGYRFDMYHGVGAAACNDFSNIESIASCNPSTDACPNKKLQ